MTKAHSSYKSSKHSNPHTETERWAADEENCSSEDPKEVVMDRVMDSAETDKLYTRLDTAQKEVLHAIISSEYDVHIMDCKAGTGKTTLAFMGGLYLIRSHQITGIDYVRIPDSRGERLGFTKGELEEKESKYMGPAYDALLACGIAPMLVKLLQQYGLINLTTDVSLRGCNLVRRLVIIDEAQNGNLDDLKLISTRVHDNGKLALIGHSGQVDSRIPKTCGLSPFQLYQLHGLPVPWIKQSKLTKNYRGRISQWADNIDKTIKGLMDGEIIIPANL